MARLPYFLLPPGAASRPEKEFCDIGFAPAFTAGQKQRNARLIEREILLKHPGAEVLEISENAVSSVGHSLSLEKLIWHASDGRKCFAKSVFLGSHRFQNGGPYRDLVWRTAFEAGNDERLRLSGELTGFEFGQEKEFWPAAERSEFASFIYIRALASTPDLVRHLTRFSAFSDTEYRKHPDYSPAELTAVFLTLARNGKIAEAVTDRAHFLPLFFRFRNPDARFSVLKKLF